MMTDYLNLVFGNGKNIQSSGCSLLLGPKSLKYWNLSLKEQLMNQFSKALDRFEYINEDLKQKTMDFSVTFKKKDGRPETCDGRFLALNRVRLMLGMCVHLCFTLVVSVTSTIQLIFVYCSLGIQLRTGMSYFLRWFNTHKMINEFATIFQDEDVTILGQRVKHINIIDYAQGFIYKERGTATSSENFSNGFRSLLWTNGGWRR